MTILPSIFLSKFTGIADVKFDPKGEVERRAEHLFANRLAWVEPSLEHPLYNSFVAYFKRDDS